MTQRHDPCIKQTAHHHLLLPRSQQIPAIHHDNLPIQILIRRREQHRARHVPIMPRPPRRDLALELLLLKMALLVRPALARRHLARIHARRDGIDAHLEPVVGDLEGQQLGEVVGRALGRVVGEVVLRRLGDAGDGRDVDDRARVAVLLLRRRLQEGQEGGRHEEELRDVGGIGVAPLLERGVFVVEEVARHFFCGLGFGALRVHVDAGVVDEDAEALFLGRDLVYQALDVVLVRDVGGDGDDFAGDVLAMHLDDALEFLFRAAGDVHFGAVDGEGLHAH